MAPIDWASMTYHDTDPRDRAHRCDVRGCHGIALGGYVVKTPAWNMGQVLLLTGDMRLCAMHGLEAARFVQSVRGPREYAVHWRGMRLADKGEDHCYQDGF